MPQSTHETYSRDPDESPGPERSFGFVMAGAFTLLGITNCYVAGQWWTWLGGIAVVFFIAAFLAPAWLRPLNWVWFKFGMLLHAIVSPAILGLLFYATVFPTGLIMRAMGKDLLRLKRDPAAPSYWIERQPPGPEAKSLKDQF